jgi:hypothetical protein
MFRRVTNVEPINTMWSKGGALSRSVMDDDSGAGHCKWSAIKIEIAK